MLPRNAGSWYARDHGCAPRQTDRGSSVNIRELDEESRRTGVWPPRRIILRVEDGEVDAAESVKVGEVDLNAPRATVATPKPREVPPLPAPSLSPSVTPSRRRGLPGARGVTPAPAAAPEDAEFEQWVSSPLPDASSEPEYQEPPAWLPDDVRLHADRRHRRAARKARTQLFGASAATTLAIGGCAAALAVVGLSQTESVGGSIGVPSIGLFGTPPEQTDDNDSAEAAKAKPAEPKRSRTRRAQRSTSSSGRASAAAPRSTPTVRRSTSTPTRRASSTPAASDRARAQPVRNPSPPPVQQQRQVSNPPPPPPPPPPAAPPRNDPQPSAGAPVVFDAPSQASSRPAPSTAPSRPVASAPAPTTSAPAP